MLPIRARGTIQRQSISAGQTVLGLQKIHANVILIIPRQEYDRNHTTQCY